MGGTLKERRMLASPPRKQASNEKCTNVSSGVMGAAPTTAVDRTSGGAALAPAWSECVQGRTRGGVGVSEPGKQING